MRRWRFWAARVCVERFRGRVRTSSAGCVEFAIQRVRCPGDAARFEAAHLLHRQCRFSLSTAVESVQVWADQRVDACVVFHDREGAGVGEHVAGNLGPVDDPSGVAGELVEHDVLTARVHVSERMDREARTFRSDATCGGPACFRAFGPPGSRLHACVGVEWDAPMSPDGARPYDSGRFPEDVIRVVSHVIHHSVALDAIMMG